MSVLAPVFAGANVGSALATDEPWTDEKDETPRHTSSTPRRQARAEHHAKTERETYLSGLHDAAKSGLPRPAKLDQEGARAWAEGEAAKRNGTRRGAPGP